MCTATRLTTIPTVYFNGSFAFTGNETGLDFADFLLGVDSSYTQGDAQHFYNRNWLTGVYGQDSWQVRPGLTLNYGVRWDRLPFWHEKYNQLQTLVPGEQSVVFPMRRRGLCSQAIRACHGRWQRRRIRILGRGWGWPGPRNFWAKARRACGRAGGSSTRRLKVCRRRS